MAIVKGKIQPLKLIREILDQKSITRFNSIREIDDFLKNYEFEISSVPSNERILLEKEIESIENVIELYREKRKRNFIYNFFYGFKLCFEIFRINNLNKNFENKLQKRVEKSLNKIKYLKKTAQELSPIIAGARGENKVVNEIKKLPDSFYLINDFNISFDPPIYIRQNNDWVFSIQVDHLLICNSGVFIIETKNWSAKSVQNLDLRSPVDQIKRSNFALFISLNNNIDVELLNHHWGDKKIPVRNIIVMTNNRPREEFNFVKILSVESLNNYVNFFEPIFNENEVETLFQYLYNWNQINS